MEARLTTRRIPRDARANINKNSTYNPHINSKPVSDGIVSDSLREGPDNPDCASGLILDGFPRKTQRAEALSASLETKENQTHVALSFGAEDAATNRGDAIASKQHQIIRPNILKAWSVETKSNEIQLE
ncbi:MAG: adenylate kinase family enzyme [Candidatus Azotimanducaceae bacterium]|jgi:adenylate kinase family enzyme